MLFANSASAGNVAKFYRANPNVGATLPASASPVMEPRTGNVQQDLAENLAEGRQVVGYSSFNGPPASDKEVLAFANKLGAAYVLQVSKYRNSVAGPSFGSTNFTRFGAFSFALPSTIDRFDQVDFFLADSPRRGIGLSGRPLKPDEAALLGTNKGVFILAVRRGSPAFNADVLPEDVVTTVNGNAVYDVAMFKAAVIASYGTTATLHIVRGGKPIMKQVSLPKDGDW